MERRISHKNQPASPLKMRSERPDADHLLKEKSLERRKNQFAKHVLKVVKSLVNIGLKDFWSKLNAYQVAMNLWKLKVIAGDADCCISYHRLVISRGRLAGFWESLLLPLEDCQVNISWDVFPYVVRFMNPTDNVMLLFYNVDKELFVARKYAAKRWDMGVTVKLPDTSDGDRVHVWGFLMSKDHLMVSKSEYFGEIKVNDHIAH